MTPATTISGVYHPGKSTATLNGMAEAFANQKDWGEAMAIAGAILEDSPETHNTTGRYLMHRKRFEEALASFDVAINAGVQAAHVNKAACLGWLGRTLEAVQECAQAPDSAAKYIQMASLYEDVGQIDVALEAVRRGLDANPNVVERNRLVFARGCYKLLQSDLSGLVDLESRPSAVTLRERMAEYPELEDPTQRFDGALLVVGEQGVGDQIMWARYLPMLNARDIVLRVDRDLARLMDDNFNYSVVTDDRDIPHFDAWIPMGSLMRHFYHRMDSVPYLKSEYTVNRVGRNVGVCWKGSPRHVKDHLRSVPVEVMNRMISGLPVNVYNLQKGSPHPAFLDLAEQSMDLADMAALISQLQLVITVDTAVAHLAGALGVPVWMMSYEPGDYRWKARAWYDSMKIYRQPSFGDWASVERQVRDDLYHWSAGQSSYSITPALNKPSTTHTVHGDMAIHPNDVYVSRSLAEYGDWSKGERHVFREYAKMGAVVVEVGSNVGAHTIPLGKLVGSTGVVHAFEPCAESAELLCQNLNACGLLNDYDRPAPVRVYRMAVGRASCEAIVVASASNPGGAMVIPEPSGASGGMVNAVQVIPLDNFQWDRLDFLKVDAEGSEEDILRGAEQTIRRCRPVMYVEDDRFEKSSSLLLFIWSLDYRIYRHMPRLFDLSNYNGNRVNVFGNLVSSMLLCIPNERKGVPDIEDLDRVIFDFE